MSRSGMTRRMRSRMSDSTRETTRSPQKPPTRLHTADALPCVGINREIQLGRLVRRLHSLTRRMRSLAPG
jgi:hypothetical protein